MPHQPPDHSVQRRSGAVQKNASDQWAKISEAIKTLPSVRTPGPTKVRKSTRTVRQDYMPGKICYQNGDYIIKLADALIESSISNTLNENGETVCVDARRCFLATEADVVNFASVFVQPAIHRYAESLVDSYHFLRGREGNTFTHMAEVTSEVKEISEGVKKMRGRSDLLYYADDKSETNDHLKAGDATSPKERKKPVFCIVEYKRFGSISYTDFQKAIAKQTGSDHVNSLLSQGGLYRTTNKCDVFILTDLNGCIVVEYGETTNVYVLPDRNNVARGWLAAFMIGWSRLHPNLNIQQHLESHTQREASPSRGRSGAPDRINRDVSGSRGTHGSSAAQQPPVVERSSPAGRHLPSRDRHSSPASTHSPQRPTSSSSTKTTSSLTGAFKDLAIQKKSTSQSPPSHDNGNHDPRDPPR